MKNINGIELRDIQAKERDVVLIDVRTKEETLSGKISGAINIDIMAPGFAEKIQEYDKSKKYIMICRSGNRSASACGFMEQAGFQNIYNLAGGMMEYDGEVV